eukprot:4925683-Pyramimonas_sp.AAC.1
MCLQHGGSRTECPVALPGVVDHLVIEVVDEQRLLLVLILVDHKLHPRAHAQITDKVLLR